MSEWIEYNSENKTANRLPSVPTADAVGRWSDLCWVHDAFYEGVTLARWTQNGDDPTTGWWVGLNHGDDIGVTHWQPLEKPSNPSEVSE